MSNGQSFELHPRLRQDTFSLGQFELCRVLLMNESRYPWLILVPERAAVTEIFELSTEDQCRLIQESSLIAQHLRRVFNADKLNVAAIGNLVPQLHVHHVVRFRDDPAWPAPVWGRLEPDSYTTSSLSRLLERLNLSDLPGFIPDKSA